MAEKTVRGRFVWHDLMTPDTAGAQAFYSKVLGWKSQPWDQDPSYTLFAAPSGPLGGSVASPQGTPHWLSYIGTPDIDDTIRQATSRGGRIVTEPTELPNGGKYAVLSDPQGAVFGLYWSASEPEPEKEPKRGEFSWHELATSDYKAAFDFYSALFGWEKTSEVEMGEGLGTYFMFGRNGVPLGGMANMGPAPAWLGYVRVKDVNQTVKKVKSARGQLISGPMEVPGGDWIAQFMDPYGTPFAVHATAADMKAKPAAAAPAAAEAVAEAPAAAEPVAAKPAKKAAKKPAAKKAAAKAKKPAARKSAKARKKAAPKKKGAAAKSAKRPARKAGKKKVATKKKRSGGKKKTAKRPRKGK